MATTLYVDGDVGVDTNSGSSEGAAVTASGAGGVTNATSTVDLSADLPDLSGVSAGDTIRLNGQSEGHRSSDLYLILTVDDGTDIVTVSPTPSTSVGSITWAIGGAVKTIQRAIDTTEANVDSNKIWIKASVTYTEAANVGTFFGKASIWGVIEGYTTTPGDSGIVTIDGESSRATGVIMTSSGGHFVVVKNIYCLNHTATGFGSLACDSVNYLRCRSGNNGGDGFRGDGIVAVVDCYTHDNSGHGIQIGGDTEIINTLIIDNGDNGILFDGGLVWNCIIKGSADIGIEKTSVSNNVALIDNTIDGDGKTTDTGIKLANSNSIIVINNIVTDCTTGILGAAGMDTEKVVSENNLVYDNGTNYSNFTTHKREFTSDPEFLAPATLDYSVGQNSEAGSNGHTLGILPWATMVADRSSIGAMPALPSQAGIVTLGSPGLHINGDLG